MDKEPYWKVQKRLSEERKKLKIQYPLLGKRVRRMGRSDWEEGEITLIANEKNPPNYIEYGIKYDNDGSFEQLDYLPYELWDEKLKKWVDN